MVKKRDKKSLKNIAYLVSRNKTKQEILKVIFPNGLEVGLEDGQFHTGAKINGNMQVTGIINADDVRIKGGSVGVFAFEPPSISLDASSAGRVSTYPATAFTEISPPSSNLSFDGHNAGRTPASTSYEIVSGDVTAICDNTSGTTLTASTTGISGEGDDSYVINLENSATDTILQITVTKASGDAKLSVTAIADNATGSELVTTIVVTVPIKTSTTTVNKSFTVLKNIAGAAGTGKNAVSINVSPSVIPVNTSVTGGAPNGHSTSERDGVGATSGAAFDIYQHLIPDTAFSRVSVLESVTPLVYDGFVSGSFIFPSAGKFFIQGHQVTASLDTGTVVSASCTAFPSNGTDDFGITGSIGTYPIFNLQFEDDGNDAKMSITFLSEHATSTTDFNHVKIDVPISVTTAAGDSQSNLIRSFFVQKAPQPEDPVDGTDGSSPPTFSVSPSIIPVETSVTGGTPNGVNTSTVAGVGASSGQAEDIYEHDIPSTSFVMADGFLGASQLTYHGFASGSVFTDPGKFRIQGHQITASLDTGTVVSASCTAFPSDGTLDFGITGSIGTYPIFNLQVEDVGNDAKMALTFLSEHATSTTDFNSVKIDVPFATRTNNNIVRSFTVQKQKRPSDPVDGTIGSDGTSPPSFSVSPQIIAVETSVTGGTPNGVNTSTVAGVGASSGQAGDIYQHDIPSTTFAKANGFLGASVLTYDGYAGTSDLASSATKFLLQAGQITGSTDTGSTVTVAASGSPSAGTDDIDITGSIGSYPIFNAAITKDVNAAKIALTFLSEHAQSTNDFNSVNLDIPFATNATNNIIRSLTLQKRKKARDGADGSPTAGAITVEQYKADMQIFDGGGSDYYWDGSNRGSVDTDYNIWDLHTAVANVGSQFAQDALVVGKTFTSNTTDLVNSDATVEHDGITNLIAGLHITADNGIPAGTTVSSITDDDTFEMSQNATGNHSNEQTTFGPVGRIKLRHGILEIETGISGDNPDTTAYDSIKITQAMTIQLTATITLEFGFCPSSGLTFGRNNPAVTGMCCIVTHNDVDASSAADAADLDIGTELAPVDWSATYGSHESFPMEGSVQVINISTIYTLGSDENRYFWLRVGNIAKQNYAVGVNVPAINVKTSRLSAVRIL